MLHVVTVFAGSLYINEKIDEIKRAEAERARDVTGAAEPERADLLTYLLSKENLSLSDVFVNVNEILLSGIDTVSGICGDICITHSNRVVHV